MAHSILGAHTAQKRQRVFRIDIVVFLLFDIKVVGKCMGQLYLQSLCVYGIDLYRAWRFYALGIF